MESALIFTDQSKRCLVEWRRLPGEQIEVPRFGEIPGGKVWKKVPIRHFQGLLQFCFRLYISYMLYDSLKYLQNANNEKNVI